MNASQPRPGTSGAGAATPGDFWQPLPVAIPLSGADSSEPTPAGAVTPVWPTAAARPAPAATPLPAVPSRPADKRRWRATWFQICGKVKEGWGPKQISTWLEHNQPQLARRKPEDLDEVAPVATAETLEKIIRAGEAGLLD